MEEAQPEHQPQGGRSNAAVAEMKRKTPDGVPNLSAYVIAKITDDPRSAGDNIALRKVIKEGRGWSIKKVAAMKTEEIEDQLAEYGVRHSSDRFLRLADSRVSAWSISDAWIDEDRIQCSGKAGGPEDFLGLAACELWKRLKQDLPSIEMIDDWMQQGYDLVEKEERAEACDLWWKVWSAIRDRILTPKLTTMHAADEFFSGSQSIFNWSQDFETELGNAAIKDERFAILLRQYCSEWAAQ